MIGIIGAMDIEVDGIKKHIENIKTEKISNITFWTGQIFGKDICLVKSGEGKVNAAMAAQTLIVRYKPDFVVNTGIAGALHHDMNVLDIALATDVCQHDVDITPRGFDPGFIMLVESVKMKCDDKLNQLIEKCAKDVYGRKIFKGTIASGDQFIASESQKNRIRSTFDAIAAEMECASIGQVCTLNNVRYAALRIMSDGANDDASMTYDEFAPKAANMSINIILEFLKNTF